MTTTPVQETTTMPITSRVTYIGPDEKKYYTVEEFMDKLAKRLGQHYGLNDIREAL